MKQYIWHIAWLALVMTVGWQGLYFKHDFYVVALVVALIGLVTMLIRRSTSYIYILGLSTITLLPLLAGVAPHFVAEGFVRAVTYLFLFILIQTYGTKDVRLFYVAGIVVTLWSYFQPNLDAGRYGGVFEYANVTAIVVGAFFLFGLLQYVGEQRPKLALFWLLPLLPMATLVALTASRGALLALAAAWLLALWLVPSTQQLLFVTMTIAHIGLVAMLPFPVVFIGSIGVVLIHWGMRKLTWQPSPLLLPLISVIIGGIVVVSKWQGIQQMLTGRNTATERFVHWRDGLLVAQDSLWFGHGYGGFARHITRFQSEPYRTIEAHNGYLDLVINYGVVGAVALVGVVVWLAYQVIKAWQPTAVAPLIFISAIAIHSALDFTQAYGFVGILVVYAFALLYTPRVITMNTIVNVVMLPAIAFGVMYITGTTLIAQAYDKHLAHVSDAKAYEQTLQRAIRLDRNEPLYAIKQLAYEVKVYEQTETTVHYEQVIQTATAIAERFFASPTVLLQVAMYLEALQAYEQSEALVERVIALDRYEEQAYALGIKIASQQALTYFITDDQRYEKAVAHARAFEQRVNQAMLQNADRRWDFRVTEEAHYYLAMLALQRGEDEAVLQHTEAVLYATYAEAQVYKEHAAALRAIVLTRQGQLDEVARYEQQYPGLRAYQQQYEKLQPSKGALE